MGVLAKLCSFAIALAAAPAAASQLIVRAPASCPSDLRARVEQRLGESLDSVILDIAVDIEEGDGFVARIDAHRDIRTLSAPHCDELVEAVAVVIVRIAQEVPRGSVELGAPRLAVAERPWRFAARVSASGGVGVVPDVATGGELALIARRRVWFGELASTLWAPRGAQLNGVAGVDVGLVAFAARAGRELAPARIWLVGEGGVLRGTGVGLANAMTGSAPWIAAGAGTGVSWRIAPRVELVGSLEALVALERSRFSLGSGDVIYMVPPVSARVTCGFEFTWEEPL